MVPVFFMQSLPVTYRQGLYLSKSHKVTSVATISFAAGQLAEGTTAAILRSSVTSLNVSGRMSCIEL